MKKQENKENERRKWRRKGKGKTMIKGEQVKMKHTKKVLKREKNYWRKNRKRITRSNNRWQETEREEKEK